MQAVVIVIVGLVIIWISMLPQPTSEAYFLTVGTRWSLLAAILIIGGIAGWRSLGKTSLYLQGHWLAWCLYDRHHCNERCLRGVLAGLRGSFLVACVGALSLHWTDASKLDLVIAVTIFAAGFMLAFVVRRKYTRSSAFVIGERSSSRGMPAMILLQLPQPASAMSCGIILILMVTLVATWAVHVGNSNLLGIALAVAFLGFTFCRSFLFTGAVALHALLRWTGVAPWRANLRLLWLPIAFAASIVTPIVIAAAILDQSLWFTVALSVPVIAAYGAVVRIVSDLVQLREGGSSAFRIINSLLPLAALSTGPFAGLILPLHLGWLLRRGNRAWKERT